VKKFLHERPKKNEKRPYKKRSGKDPEKEEKNPMKEGKDL